MYGARSTEPSPPRQWSVHAEFTISHPGVDDPKRPPRTSVERDDGTGGVRMTYTWTASEEESVKEREKSWPISTSTNPSSDSIGSKSLSKDSSGSTVIGRPLYGERNAPFVPGFQKGNLYFTSTPPSKLQEGAKTQSAGVVRDSSGYGSDLLSPNSQQNSLPRRSAVPHCDRKCRSTCNIVLSANLGEPGHSQCGRTQSLRCQTPSTVRSDGDVPTNRYYGCGDPWCHHLHRNDDFACPGRISPVPENGENGETTPNYLKRPPRAFTFAPGDHHRAYGSGNENVLKKKDACVQTFEMIDKCTSPYLRVDSQNEFLDKKFSLDRKTSGKNDDKFQTDQISSVQNDADKVEKRSVKNNLSGIDRKAVGSERRRRYLCRKKPDSSVSSVDQRVATPSSISLTPDSLESMKPSRKLTHSPKLRRLPAFEQLTKEHSPVESKSSDSQKKPRTVHIDVYCTGTEMESGPSSDESGSKTASTPQTVFENEKLKIIHKNASEKDLPHILAKKLDEIGDKKEIPYFLRKKLTTVDSKSEQTSLEREDSDDDNISTAYPSKLSSYSTIGDFSGSISSVPRSWTTYSMSSCAIPEDYDSVANTSWKDTFSDFDSLMQSRASLAQTDSLDFVPRKLNKNPSIDETPEFERRDLFETPTVASLNPSDSFEYANSEDRLRIKRMEEFWRNKNQPRVFKPPVSEKTLQMQQRKMQEYMDKTIKGKAKWETKESDSSESDESEKGWTFIKSTQDDPTGVQKEFTDKKPSNINNINNRGNPKDPELKVLEHRPLPIQKSPPLMVLEDQGSLSDSSPTHSPNYISLKQRLSLDPNLRSPFTLTPGIYSEPRTIAKKFGEIVNVMKKPGHHIGPAKNPECLCDHCQNYWENKRPRNRTRSMGDHPSEKAQNWKDLWKESKDEATSLNIKLPFSEY